MKLGHEISESRARYPEITSDLLQELQDWATARNLGKVPQEQLAIFAHSCYYDKPKTFQCMETYYRMRATVPEFFNDRDVNTQDNLKHMMKFGFFICLPKPDREGNRIVCHGLSDSNSSNYIFQDSVKLLFMTMDASLHDAGCAPGHIFLFDMRCVRITHLTRVTIAGLRHFFEYIQEAMPVRLKRIHVINCVWFFDKVLSIIKPFMKKELMDILYLHSGDISDVYQYIPPECLPKDFGGELDDIKTLNEAQKHRFGELRDYYQEEEQLYRGFKSTGTKKSSASVS